MPSHVREKTVPPPNPDVVVAVVACALLLIVVGSVRARRDTSAAVRLAIRDPRSETRRAAVVVAARHGLARYARLLAMHARHEQARDVLITLAEAVREHGCPGRGPSAKLRRWSESFLSQVETSESAHGDERSGRSHSRQDGLSRAVGVIDALEVVTAQRDDDRPPSPRRTSERRLPAQVWTAGPGQLDALAVVASLEDRPYTYGTTQTPPRPDARHPERRRPVDHEALLDRIAGVAVRHPQLAGWSK